jgi:hypothetical protein
VTPSPRDITEDGASSGGALIALLVCGIAGGIIGFLIALALGHVFGPESACR